jgi:chemotaxis signal transduction protein
MNSDRPAESSRAAALAHAFDRSFAEPLSGTPQTFENLLGLRVEGDAYAIRLGEVTGLVADRRIVPLPTTDPDLLGVVGLRGSIVPVYGLRGLLGYGPTTGSPRWLLLVGRGPLFGLAFEHFDGHLTIPQTEVSARQGDALDIHVRESIRDGNGQRRLVSIQSLTQTLTTRVATKEK